MTSPSDLINQASIQFVFDYRSAVGDHSALKFEKLFSEMEELIKALKKQGANGFSFAICSPGTAKTLEFFADVQPFDTGTDAGNGYTYYGLLNRFRLYGHEEMPNDQILLGVEEYDLVHLDEDPKHLGKITITHFPH